MASGGEEESVATLHAGIGFLDFINFWILLYT